MNGYDLIERENQLMWARERGGSLDRCPCVGEGYGTKHTEERLALDRGVYYINRRKAEYVCNWVDEVPGVWGGSCLIVSIFQAEEWFATYSPGDF